MPLLTRYGSRFFLIIFLLLSVLNVSCVTETTKNGKPYTKQDNKVNLDQALGDYVSLANSYLAQGDRENALRAINKGLAIKPDSPEMLNVLAFYYESDGESGLAEKEFLKAIDSDKSYTGSYMNYGAFLFSHQRYAEACRTIQKATDDVMYSKRGDAFTNLGMCYRKVGQEKSAEDAFARSIKHDFRNWRAFLEMAQLKFDQGEFVESQRYYDEFLKLGSQSPKSLWLGIRLAHVADDKDKVASYGLFLKNQYPSSKEYSEFSSWSATH